MATWADVDEVAGRLPGAVLGVAHEGSPAWHAGRHTFARLRWDDDGRELVQVWTGEMDTEQALADRRDTFVRIDTFRYRVTMWARLDRLDRARAGRAAPRVLRHPRWPPPARRPPASTTSSADLTRERGVRCRAQRSTSEFDTERRVR